MGPSCPADPRHRYSAVHGLEEVSVSDFLMLSFQENLSRLFSLAGRCVCFPLRGTFRLTVGF